MSLRFQNNYVEPQMENVGSSKRDYQPCEHVSKRRELRPAFNLRTFDEDYKEIIRRSPYLTDYDVTFNNYHPIFSNNATYDVEWRPWTNKMGQGTRPWDSRLHWVDFIAHKDAMFRNYDRRGYPLYAETDTLLPISYALEHVSSVGKTPYPPISNVNPMMQPTHGVDRVGKFIQ